VAADHGSFYRATRALSEQDLNFANDREWVWLIRTARRTKESALIICGFGHVFSLGNKFRQVGFEVDVNEVSR
jgi:hypothetical protein